MSSPTRESGSSLGEGFAAIATDGAAGLVADPVLPALQVGLLAALLAFLLVALIAALCVGVARRLERRARARSVADVDALPVDARPDLLVVLGCPPSTRRGRANPHLLTRAAAAARAYHALGGIEVLCSGHARAPDADPTGSGDEATALARLLAAAGVPPATIRLDRRARRTLDTIDYLAEHHARARLLIVSQAFHLPRVLFLARARALDAWGLAAPGPRPRGRNRLREALGRLRALFDVFVAPRR